MNARSYYYVFYEYINYLKIALHQNIASLIAENRHVLISEFIHLSKETTTV